MKGLGRYEEAKRFLEKAARRAIYTGRKRQAGEAHHDLLGVAAEVGEFKTGERHARKALEYYPIHHPRMPLLVQDWAFVLVRCRFYSPAVHLFQLALPCVHSPVLQTLIWGNLARAASGARNEQTFRSAESAVLQLVEKHSEFAASAFNGLAEGSWVFEDWEEARQFATRALEVARVRNDGGEEQVSLSLLEKIANRHSAPIELPPCPDSILTLNLRFEARLKKWRAPGKSVPGADPAS